MKEKMFSEFVNTLKNRYNELAYCAKKFDNNGDEAEHLIMEGRKMEVYLMICEFGEHIRETIEYNGEEIYGFAI